MTSLRPDEVLRFVLTKVADANWQSDRGRLSNELAECLTEDLFDGPYEFMGVSSAVAFSKPRQSGDVVEIIVSGGGLPDKAVLKLGPDGNWRLASFWGQCTGCLGSGEILGKDCTSCSGTGWGLRPS